MNPMDVCTPPSLADAYTAVSIIVALAIFAGVVWGIIRFDLSSYNQKPLTYLAAIVEAAVVATFLAVVGCLLMALVHHGAWADYAQCVFKQRELVGG